ncbi:Cupredoxin [Sporormia fimetaria CBS 119925]|uniref:Cupredoxin n=1 Tax=Sporormia fimetaria CBS 119925 TaxID=1340428 RepID=A0A6A6VLF2_9PLEO|nr:Cupredoxin [Sporormia fimetaria CBS 119925]
MLFSKTFVTCALLGLTAATSHEVQAPAHVAPPAEHSPPAVHTSAAVAAPVHSSPPPAHAPVAEAPPAHSPPAVVETPLAHTSSAVVAAPPVHESTTIAEASLVHTSTVVAEAPAHTSTVAAHTSQAPQVHASPPPAHASSAPAAGTVKTHVVQVGGPNGTLLFYPENLVAQPGDLVQFQFNPKNHSVVQSTFDQPCVPIQNIMPNKTDAFYSGFMPTNASSVAAGNKLTYTIRVMDTKPIWYYCSQGPHCQNGMVGAINAPASGNRTLASHKALAAAAPENLSPGQQAGQGPASPPASPGAPSSGPTDSISGGATPSAPDTPAQVTTDAAGRISQSLLMLGLTMVAAFLVL